MSSRFVDPFFPSRPVDDPLRFSGREYQVDQAVDSLYQTKHSNPKHSVITGDRGIGKSSLLFQIQHVATGDNRLPNKLGIDLGVSSFDYAVAWHDADSGQSAKHVAHGLLSEIQGALEKIKSTFKIDVNLGGFLKISERENSEETSISKLASRFCKEVKKATESALDGGKDGLLLFVDELDRVDPEGGLASFFKLTSEKLIRNKVNNAAFICAGITGAIQKLETEHASIYRTFRDIPIPLLSEDEVEEILTGGFDQVGVSYEQSVIGRTLKVSGKFPEPVHLLGSKMLSVNDDKIIDNKDFKDAKIEVVKDARRNKLKDILRSAGSGKYQKILLAMAKHDEASVPLSFISKEIGYKQNQYSSNMSTLIDRNVIKRIDTGVYSFVEPLLKEYIKHFGIIDERIE